MKINIDVYNNFVDLYSEDTNIKLGTLLMDDFLSLLDNYQLDAYYDGDTKFSLNHTQVIKKISQ